LSEFQLDNPLKTQTRNLLKPECAFVPELDESGSAAGPDLAFCRL
jgi:hypothetical protein